MSARDFEPGFELPTFRGIDRLGLRFTSRCERGPPAPSTLRPHASRPSGKMPLVLERSRLPSLSPVFIGLCLVVPLMLTACPATPPVAPDGEGGGGAADGAGSNGAASELADPTSESIGGFSNGDPMSKAEALFGVPDSKEEFWEEPATGDVIAEWVWKAKGVSITAMKHADGVIDRGISIVAPSTAKTSRGIGIGSTWAEVDAVYSPFKGQGLNPDEGEPVTWGPEQIIVGSVYGGTFFSFEDGKVTSIFVGAGAE